MMNKTLIAAILFIGFSLFRMPSAGAQDSYSKMAADVLQLINKHRTGMGLRPLQQNDIIAASAAQHSHDMATGKVPFGHDGFDQRTARIARQITPANSFAENVAEGAHTAAEVVDMWLHSPGHKKNIEGNYNLTGIGIAKGKDGHLYYTQLFILKG